MESNYDIQGIMELLAHRYPFLLIDRVNEVVPGDKITALKNVTINELLLEFEVFLPQY